MKKLALDILMRSPLGHLYRYVPSTRTMFWDAQVGEIVKHWRTGPQATADYPLFSEYLTKISPKRLLDIGCGTGRLFQLYAELGIPEVIGIDLSPAAIAKIKPYPNCRVIRMDVENLNFPPDYFDAAISNAVLRHIPPGTRITRAIANLTEQCQSIIIREVVRERGFSYDFRHDYEALFRGKMRLTEHYQDKQSDVFCFIKEGQPPPAAGRA